MTAYDLMALILSTIALSYSGVASYLLRKRVDLNGSVLSSGTPSDTLLKRVESEFRDIRLRVEKNEAHWEEMYGKFDRASKAEKARERRAAALLPDGPEEPIEKKELTRSEQRQKLGTQIRSK